MDQLLISFVNYENNTWINEHLKGYQANLSKIIKKITFVNNKINEIKETCTYMLWFIFLRLSVIN